MQSLCTLLLRIRSAQLSTENANTRGRRGGEGDGCGEDPKSEVEGRKVDQGMKRERREERIKKGLNLFTLGKERKKKTEYIDFLYSLHHLYKYIESQKKK